MNRSREHGKQTRHKNNVRSLNTFGLANSLYRDTLDILSDPTGLNDDLFDTDESKEIIKSIKQNPEDSTNYSMYGIYLFKNMKKRVEYYNKSIKKTKILAGAALTSMLKAIELDPNDSVNYSILANMLFNYDILYPEEHEPKPNNTQLMSIINMLERAIKLNKYKGSKLASLNTNTILLKRLHSIVNPEIPNPKNPRPYPSRYAERYVTEQNNIEEGNKSDIPLNCRDCGGRFPFTKGEQEFYQLRGFIGEPTRCKECRAKKKDERDASQLTPRQPKLKKTPSPNEADTKKRNASNKKPQHNTKNNRNIGVMTQEATRIKKSYTGPKPRTRSKHTRQGIPI